MNSNWQPAAMAIGRAMATDNWGNIGPDIQGYKQNQMAQRGRNLTADYLQSQGADPQIVEMARGGKGRQALGLWQETKKAERPASPLTGLGKAKHDLDAGLISQQQYDLMSRPPEPKRKIIKDSRGVQRYTDTGESVFDQTQFNQEQKSLKARGGNVVIQDIDRALEKTNDGGLPTTGIIGQAASYIPGTDAHDVSMLLDTVKANAGFDKLQAMRDASPTGGALGQVSERELSFLNSAIGNLEQSQSKEQFIDNLNRVKNIYNEIIHGNEAPAKVPLSFEGGGQNKTSSGVQWSIVD